MTLPTGRCPGPVSRRRFLKLGSLGLGGLGLGDLLRQRARAAAEPPVTDPAVIFVWLPGGPPHLEMYDLKPDAPGDYRGQYRPIDTSVPGLQVGELLPRHARIADKFTVIRSIAHQFADHGGGHKRFMTARDPKQPVGFVNDYPAVPSMIAEVRPARRRDVPVYVAGVDRGRSGIDTFSFGSAYLGNRAHPFLVAGDPSDPTFQVENLVASLELQGRLDDRLALQRKFDTLLKRIDQTGAMAALDEFQQRAVDLITSPRAREAFDLSREPDAVRDRYGRHAYGCRALMARRLVEAGCTFVTMVMENPTPGKQLPNFGTYNWDSHAVNCNIFEDLAWRLPYYDQAVTALIEDLYARGLDRRVLLIVTGEFGRTPRINPANSTLTGIMQPGRDHWPNAMSMIVAGGGMRTGQIVGATSPKGEYPIARAMTPNDLWATVLRHLGIDQERALVDHAGRPMPLLPFGTPIPELAPVA